MIRGRAAELARFRVGHPVWWVRRDGDSFIATMGNVMVAAASLERLGDLIGKAAPERDGEDG